jgi:hypothetical protein
MSTGTVPVAEFFLLSRCNMRLCLRSGEIYHECSRTGTTTNGRASYYIYNTMCSLFLYVEVSVSAEKENRLNLVEQLFF